MGTMGTLFSIESNPQLLENFLIPSSGFDLVPSGKMIIVKPLLIFFLPDDRTFFKLLIFFFLLKWIGLRHASAHPKKGIYNNPFLIMLDDGIIKVWRKNDSHWPWWLETIIHGVFGKLSIPSTSQETPQRIFKELSINLTQFDETTCKEEVLINGYRIIIINDASIKLI